MAGVREDALLHARHEHDGELQALGRVHRHHRHGAGGAGKRIQVTSQGEPLHEGGQLLGRHDHVRVDRLGGHRGGRLLAGGGVEHAGLAQLGQALQGLGHVVVGLVKLLGHAEELSDVLHAAVGLHGVLGLEGGDEPRVVHDGLDDARELAVLGARTFDHARELGKRAADLGREQARLGHAGLAGRQEGHAVHEGVALDLGHARGADAAPGRVHHAQGAHVVGRVHHELEVGRDVANLGAVEEARAAHDLVGHAGAQQHVFEDAALRVCAVEDGHVVVARALGVDLLDLGSDPAALVALVAGLVGVHQLTVAARGEQALLLAAAVVGHHGVGGVEDVAEGAVVLLELHHLGVGVVLLEVQDVLDVGATPGVDGLVVVAHDHEVAAGGGQHVRDLVLDVVGVLVLVHADLHEAVLVLLEHIGVVPQQAVRVDEQVIEVHGVGTLETNLQLAVDAGSSRERRRVGQALELVGQHEGVLGAGDLGADAVERELLGLNLEVAHDLLHKALGVVVIIDGEVGAKSQLVGVLAQDAHAHGVEGAHPHATGAAGEQGVQALAHLGGGLVGEGDGEHLPGAHALVGDHVGDAVGEHARLARAGAGEHEQGSARALGRLTLGGVEATEVDGDRRRRPTRTRGRRGGGRRSRDRRCRGGASLRPGGGGSHGRRCGGSSSGNDRHLVEGEELPGLPGGRGGGLAGRRCGRRLTLREEAGQLEVCGGSLVWHLRHARLSQNSTPPISRRPFLATTV